MVVVGFHKVFPNFGGGGLVRGLLNKRGERRGWKKRKKKRKKK